MDGTVFFVATDGVHGFELWQSDGTEAGAAMVRAINPNGDSFPDALMAVGRILFFSAEDGVHGRELWRAS